MKSNHKLLQSITPNSSSSHITYVKHHIRNTRIIFTFQLFLFIGFLLFWEMSTRVRLIDPFIFSSPSRVLKSILTMSKDGSLFYHTGITVLETFISFFLVITLGILTATLLWWNETIAKIFEPYLVVLNSLPKSALAPVFIVWIGNNMKTIIIAATSVALFGTIISLYSSFISVEEDKIKLIKTLGGTRKDILLKLVIPANIPALISIMKVNIGLSLVGVIIGEFLAAKAGLGYLIVYGSQVFKLDWVIMSIVILCILATILYKVLAYIEKKYT